MFNSDLKKQIRTKTETLKRTIHGLKRKVESPDTPPEEKEKVSGVIQNVRQKLSEELSKETPKEHTPKTKVS